MSARTMNSHHGTESCHMGEFYQSALRMRCKGGQRPDYHALIVS